MIIEKKTCGKREKNRTAEEEEEDIEKTNAIGANSQKSKWEIPLKSDTITTFDALYTRVRDRACTYSLYLAQFTCVYERETEEAGLKFEANVVCVCKCVNTNCIMVLLLMPLLLM